MKRILITGANSYIGTSFETYIKDHFSDDYYLLMLSQLGTALGAMVLSF